MAKRKPPSGQRLRQIKTELAALKKAGLYSGDSRRAKGTSHQQSLIRKYRDVLDGKAKTVKVGKDAKQFDKSLRAKNGRVVVEAQKGEKFRYTKSGIVSTRKERGVSFRRIVLKRGALNAFTNLPTPPKGKKYFFKLPHNPTMERAEMQRLLNKYKNHNGIFQSVEIFEADEAEFPGLDDEDFLAELMDLLGEDGEL